jgi:RimJ/RimL family protein N-acetyltransferase
VHVGVRSLLPPFSDSVVLLGEDHLRRLVAVAFLCDVEQGDGIFLMKLVAVGVELDCQGEGYGVEAIEMAIRAAETRGFGAGAWLVTVIGQVHVRNTASKKACQKAGLTRFGTVGDYEEWGASVELPDDMRQR